MTAGSEAIYDDLRILRCRRGFPGAEARDLAGTTAALQKYANSAASFDDALRSIRRFVSAEIDELLEDAADLPPAKQTGAILAAWSLRSLLLPRRVQDVDYVGIRQSIGADAHRDHDYIRKQEDVLLRSIAQTYVARIAEGLIVVGGRPAQGPALRLAILRLQDSVRHVVPAYTEREIDADGSTVKPPKAAPADFIRSMEVIDLRFKEVMRTYAKAIVMNDAIEPMLELFLMSTAQLFRAVEEDRHVSVVGDQKHYYRVYQSYSVRDRYENLELRIDELWMDARHHKVGLLMDTESEVCLLGDTVQWLAASFGIEADVSRTPRSDGIAAD